MKLPAIFLLCFSLAVTVCFAGEAIEHADADGKYKVFFPAKPKLSAVKGRANLTIYYSAVERADSTLTVNYYDIPVDLPGNDDFVKRGLLSEARTLLTRSGGELKDHRYVKFQKDYWSIEYGGPVAKPFPAQMRARSVAVGKRIYNVVVLGSPDFIKSEAATKFFDSFQVTK